MGKLFISLYVYIIVSLFIVSGVIEQIWPYEETQQQVLLDDEFGQALWLLSQTEDGLDKLKHSFESQVIARKDLILPLKQQASLDKNQYLYRHQALVLMGRTSKYHVAKDLSPFSSFLLYDGCLAELLVYL